MMLMSKKGVLESLPAASFHVPAYVREPLPVYNKEKQILWRLESPFKLTVSLFDF